MKRIKLFSLVLLLIVAACLPVIGNNKTMSISSTRDGTVVTAILRLNEDAQQVLVSFDGPTFHKQFKNDFLEAGSYSYEVMTLERVACSASANINGRPFEVFC